jgi:hypothetical protein
MQCAETLCGLAGAASEAAARGPHSRLLAELAVRMLRVLAAGGHSVGEGEGAGAGKGASMGAGAGAGTVTGAGSGAGASAGADAFAEAGAGGVAGVGAVRGTHDSSPPLPLLLSAADVAAMSLAQRAEAGRRLVFLLRRLYAEQLELALRGETEDCTLPQRQGHVESECLDALRLSVSHGDEAAAELAEVRVEVVLVDEAKLRLDGRGPAAARLLDTIVSGSSAGASSGAVPGTLDLVPPQLSLPAFTSAPAPSTSSFASASSSSTSASSSSSASSPAPTFVLAPPPPCLPDALSSLGLGMPLSALLAAHVASFRTGGFNAAGGGSTPAEAELLCAQRSRLSLQVQVRQSGRQLRSTTLSALADPRRLIFPFVTRPCRTRWRAMTRPTLCAFGSRLRCALTPDA